MLKTLYKFTQEEAEAKSLTVGIKMIGNYINSTTYIEFECPYCKKYFKATPKSIWAKTTVSDKCQRGGKNYTGFELLSGQTYQRIKNNAKTRNLEFNLTKEYLWNLFIQQNQTCKLTNLNIILSRNMRKEYSTYKEQTASLDRIDSTKGYVEGNVQWVHKDINQMKMEFSQEKFIELCKLVAQHNV